jgi:hypothetical protein
MALWAVRERLFVIFFGWAESLYVLACYLSPLSHTQDKKRPLGLRVEVFPLTIPRDERGSMLLTSNLPFSKWEVIFKDPMTTAAAIDRLVHHSVVLELNVPSYRAEEAREGKNQDNQSPQSCPPIGASPSVPPPL